MMIMAFLNPAGLKGNCIRAGLSSYHSADFDLADEVRRPDPVEPDSLLNAVMGYAAGGITIEGSRRHLGRSGSWTWKLFAEVGSSFA